MKKILLFAAAMLALAGCKDPNGATSSASDDITVAPENRTVGGDGGNVQVIVTSTGDWTLASKDGKA